MIGICFGADVLTFKPKRFSYSKAHSIREWVLPYLNKGRVKMERMTIKGTDYIKLIKGIELLKKDGWIDDEPIKQSENGMYSQALIRGDLLGESKTELECRVEELEKEVIELKKIIKLIKVKED